MAAGLSERDFVEWFHLLARMNMKDELLVAFSIARKQYPENPKVWFSAIDALKNTDARKAQKFFDIAVSRWADYPYANYLKIKLKKNLKVASSLSQCN